MVKNALKIGGLLLLLVVVVMAVLFVQQQGWLPWLQQPNYRINATVVLERIQDMSMLTTTRFNYSSLVTSEREMPALLGALYGEKQVMVAVGYVVAGVEMGKITEADISWDDGVLSIKLPAPTLQDCFLDEQASYIVSRDTGVFSRSAPTLDTEARRFAIQQFRSAALEGGILEKAQEQSVEIIEQFINLLAVDSIKELKISVGMPDPNAPLPNTCA